MKRDFLNSQVAFLGLAITLFAVFVPAAVQADSTSDSNWNVASNALAKHVVAGGGLPTGSFSLDARSYDTLGPHGPGSTSTNSGFYKLKANHAASTAETTDPGALFDPKARGSINWGPGFWTSEGSYAKIDDGPNQNSTAAESAYANAFVLDPQFYSIKFDSNFKPEIDFSLTISAGATLIAQGTSGVWSTASLSGSYFTSVLAGPLWGFSWSADSNQPNSSDFQFWSNPLLGLDDNAISSEFLADVTDAFGTHTLNQDFTVSVALFPTLPKGQWDLTFSTGGFDDYYAAASAPGETPEPSSLLLVGSGVLGLGGFLRRRWLAQELAIRQISN